MLKVGVIGAGHLGVAHIKILKSINVDRHPGSSFPWIKDFDDREEFTNIGIGKEKISRPLLCPVFGDVNLSVSTFPIEIVVVVDNRNAKIF